MCDSRERDNDEKRSIVALLLHEVGDEGNGLDGLTKTHLICQDSVEMVVVERHKPLQTFDLVRKREEEEKRERRRGEKQEVEEEEEKRGKEERREKEGEGEKARREERGMNKETLSRYGQP